MSNSSLLDKPKRSRPLVTSIKIMTPGDIDEIAFIEALQVVFNTCNPSEDYFESLRDIVFISMIPSEGGNTSPQILPPFELEGQNAFFSIPDLKLQAYLSALRISGVKFVNLTIKYEDNSYDLFSRTSVYFQ
ncbi:MAG: hypothetical protein ACPGXL_10195 [Chitinophagales bacterium]